MITIDRNGCGIDLIRNTNDVVRVASDAPPDVVQRVRERMQLVAERDSWMRYRLRGIAENIKQNLRVLDGRPSLVTPMRRAWGKTAVVVSAGASIDSHIGDIIEASNTACVYVTNSASHSVIGDVIVYIESLRSVIAPANDIAILACDVSCYPEVFDRDDLAHAFFKSEASYSRLAERYRARSITYGTSVSTAAVALAAAHGARRIILVGQDLAYDAEDGRVYNAGSPLAGMRIEIDEASEVGTYVNVPDGVRRPPVQMQRLGESSLYTTHDFIAVGEWLEGFAQRHREIECINATTKGMKLHGWIQETLSRALIDAPSLPYGAEPFPELDGLELSEQLRLCRRWEMLRPEVQLYTTIAKLDMPDYERAEDAVKCVIEMYCKAAEELDHG